MMLTLCFNLVINLYYLVCYAVCDMYNDCSDNKFLSHFIGEDLSEMVYLCISGLLLILYFVLCLSYIIVILKIMKMLKQGFIELYNQSKVKLFAGLLVF